MKIKLKLRLLHSIIQIHSSINIYCIGYSLLAVVYVHRYIVTLIHKWMLEKKNALNYENVNLAVMHMPH